MTQFDDRERAFESKFAHDEEMKFRITARRNRLLGEWAARQMGLSEAETDAYSKDVVRSDFEEAGEHDRFLARRADGSQSGANRARIHRCRLASARGHRCSRPARDADDLRRCCSAYSRDMLECVDSSKGACVHVSSRCAMMSRAGG